ncbi:DNA replication ATP-dependent helicase/nuclease DNA2 isoform X2 [Diachasmimorpha longicaudata]|uniref:DNA replication ATP-dependent helicase/nuclease DNA2 isoform X2 n=1 Tax=Diachasmimorpha longicaudata TaxID=58733 RepID=UPI0030B9056B
MEKKHVSPSKLSNASIALKSIVKTSPSMSRMEKRQREEDSDGKSPLKMRKTIPDLPSSEYNAINDLIFDSDEDSDGWKSSGAKGGNKENSPKKNKAPVISKRLCSSDKAGNNEKIVQDDEKGLERQDSPWIDDIFDEFSDSEEEGTSKKMTKKSPVSQRLQSADSGLQSLGPTQTSNCHDKEEGSEKLVDSGVKSDHQDDIDELFDDDWDLQNKFCLDLSDFTRCTIIAIDRRRMSLHITVADPTPDSSATALVICSGTWMDLLIAVGESIIIKARKSFGEWVVNNEWGYCITQPDILVSGTTVSASLFCNRKAVLEARFPGLDSLPNLEPSDAVMTCGKIVHEILQTALRNKLHTLEEIKALSQRLLKCPSTIRMLYASDITTEAYNIMMKEYIPKINEFIERYIKGKQPKVPDKDFTGQIVEIRDIEENVWLPTLGLKGKIDVTVEVKLHNRRRIMPLEVKTGRTVFSAQHKGQLYLYTMMLKTLGYDVDSGLLLYIKDNQMQEIKSSIHDQRGLISMRNLLAHYLAKPAARIANTGASEGELSVELMELPEPIHHNFCRETCPYRNICSVFAEEDKNLSLSDRHPISVVRKSLTEELTKEHINYVTKWLAFLEMDEAQNMKEGRNDNIWNLAPIAREKRKTGLVCMEVSKVVAVDNVFYHEFVREKGNEEDFPVKDFRQVFHGDEYVTISSEKRYHLASGFLNAVTKTSLGLRLERDLSKHEEKIYSIDILSLRNQLYRIFGTLGTLLSSNDITRRMRRLIIDKEPARFTEPLPSDFNTPGARRILDRLNKYQQEALTAVLTANDYVLIKGMPGTGKTETLVALIELLSYLGKSVIITAHTHNAVDNILLKLDQRKVDFMRLGSDSRLHPELIHKSESVLTKDCDSPEKLGLVYDKQKIIGITCHGAGHFLLARRMFDYCVVDECTQVLQPVLLKPLYSASKFVFVGDPQQLPAVIRSIEARRLGMDEDIFNRLDSPNNTRSLKLQYRMNQTIMNLANEFMYKGELCIGNETVANATLKFKCPEKVAMCEKWVQRALDNSLEKAVTVLNTGEIANFIAHTRLQRSSFLKTKEQSEGATKGTVNWYEIVVIQRLVTALINGGVSPEEIGVIAPFRAQINLLRTVIKEDVEINTVDQYQGRDKSVIIFSCTKSNRRIADLKSSVEYRVLEDPKRLNVAVTRAKHKIIIVGDVPLLLEYGLSTKELFTILRKDVWDLEDNVDEFSWDRLFKDLVVSRGDEGSQSGASTSGED